MQKYRLLNHTADFGIEVWGKTLDELFINAATGMYELIADLKKVLPENTISFEIKAQDKNELLRNWLAELLYYFSVKDIIFCKFKIIKLNDNYIKSQAMGEKINQKKHTLFHEVKAVTFHNLNIEEKNGTLTTEIIFDV